MKWLRLFLTLCPVALLAACAGPGKVQRPPAAGERPQVSRTLPFPEPRRPAVHLDESLLYDYLVGEIGARLGAFDEALEAYLEAAERAQDPYAAERATRIAWHVNRTDLAARAAALWVRLSPNSLAARQYYALALLRDGRSEEALLQLRAMESIARAEQKEGLVLIAAALAREPDREAALQLMQRLVADRRSDPEAAYAMGILLAAQQRWGEAEQVLRGLLQRGGARAEAYGLLARVLTHAGRAKEAVTVLEEGTARFPDNRLLRLTLARQLVAAQRYEEALEQFRQLHRLLPDDAGVTYGYAMLATQQERWKEARPLWQKLRSQPRFANEASYFLGQVEEFSGDPVTAIGLYRSVHLGELVADAAIRAASLMVRRGEDLAQARALLREARKRQPKRAVDLYLAEGQLLQQAGVGPAEVLELYAQALREFPENVDLLYARGLYYAEIGNHVAMEQDFRRVLAQDPQNADALNALGYMLAEQGIRLEEARGYIEQALRLRPDSAAILDSMGWVLYRLGRRKEALAYLRRARAKEDDAEISGHLVEVLWSLGKREEARQVLREALDRSPEDDYLLKLRRRFLSGQ